MRIDRQSNLESFRSSFTPMNRGPTALNLNGATSVQELFAPNTATNLRALLAQNQVGTDPATWTYFDQNQVAGDPNACGTTTLSMILATLGVIPPTLDAAKGVDQAVRSWGGFSAPDDLEQFAKSKGLFSEGHNDQNFGDLKSNLAAGRSVMAMVDGGSDPHWVAVQNVSEQNGQEFVTYADPASGSSKTVSRQEFEKMWDKPMQGQGGFVSGLTGYHNFLQVFDKKPVPAADDFSIAFAQAGADGVSDIGNALHDFKSIFTKGNVGGLVTGTFGLVGGAVTTALAIPGAIGRVIEMGGDKVLDWASSKWNKGGVGNKILGGLGFVGGGILKGLGWGVKQIGNVVAKVGQAIGGTVTKIGAKIVDGAKAVGHKIAEGAKAVGHAIASGVKKIFSGW